MVDGMMSLTDESVESNGRNYGDSPARVFKPQEGKVYRIRFSSGNVLMRERHYSDFKKRYYRCLAHQGFCPVCAAASMVQDKKAKGAPKKASTSFGANIFLYNTDANGAPVQPLSADVYFWAFGADKFVQIRSIIKEWGPIDTLDLLVTCTDAQFQKVTIQVARACLYSTSGPEFKAACDKKLETDSYPLDKFLCKEVPLLEMCADFGISTDIVPAEIRAQMSPQTAQDVAMAQPAANVAAHPQQAVAQPQKVMAQPQQAMPQQAAVPQQQVMAQQAQPTPPEENFSSLGDITSLL